LTVLKSDHQALKSGRTIYLKSVTGAEDAKRLLQPASTNRKLGGGKNMITRGKWRGMPMYQLSLEERKTCPDTCQQWASCYGNNMPFAKRIDHAPPEFLKTLEKELAALNAKHSQGFVVRLHVLGDFFSPTYCHFWRKALGTYTGLRIFGYTHRSRGSPIGRAIQRLNAAGAWIRWSDAGGAMSANVGGEGIPCPEQQGKTESCLTCGLCWQTTKAIQFKIH
jgi:hypothetical protein